MIKLLLLDLYRLPLKCIHAVETSACSVADPLFARQNIRLTFTLFRMIMKRAAEESGRGNRPNNNHGALADLLTPEQQALLRLGAGGDLAQLLQQSNLSSILAQQQQMGMGSFNNTLAFLQQHQRDQLLAEQLRGGLLGQSSLEALRMNQQLMGSSNAGLAGAAALKTSGEDAEKVSELPADDMDAKDGEGDEDDNDNEDEKDADTFPFKLYRMIAEAEKNGQDDIISFNAKGRCFLIHQPREFVLEIMPKYFTTSRMSSFQVSTVMEGPLNSMVCR